MRTVCTIEAVGGVGVDACVGFVGEVTESVVG
jgi:hypothetical protein